MLRASAFTAEVKHAIGAVVTARKSAGSSP
jgi:hypothetical protein